MLSADAARVIPELKKHLDKHFSQQHQQYAVKGVDPRCLARCTCYMTKCVTKPWAALPCARGILQHSQGAGGNAEPLVHHAIMGSTLALFER